jgi:hypothetical protein
LKIPGDKIENKDKIHAIARGIFLGHAKTSRADRNNSLGA